MFNHTRKMKTVVLALLISALCIPTVFAGSSDSIMAATDKAQDIEIALVNDNSLVQDNLEADESYTGVVPQGEGSYLAVMSHDSSISVSESEGSTSVLSAADKAPEIEIAVANITSATVVER